MLAHNLLKQDQPAEAEKLLREAVQISEQLELPADAPYAGVGPMATSLLGQALLRQQQPDQAEPLLLAAHEQLQLLAENPRRTSAAESSSPAGKARRPADWPPITHEPTSLSSRSFRYRSPNSPITILYRRSLRLDHKPTHSEPARKRSMECSKACSNKSGQPAAAGRPDPASSTTRRKELANFSWKSRDGFGATLA